MFCDGYCDEPCTCQCLLLGSREPWKLTVIKRKNKATAHELVKFSQRHMNENDFELLWNVKHVPVNEVEKDTPSCEDTRQRLRGCWKRSQLRWWMRLVLGWKPQNWDGERAVCRQTGRTESRWEAQGSQLFLSGCLRQSLPCCIPVHEKFSWLSKRSL